MPLISCPTCKDLISTLAVACPHCGHPMNQRGSEVEAAPSAFQVFYDRGGQWLLALLLIPLFIYFFPGTRYLLPWSLKAERVARASFRGQGAEVVAGIIQGTLHPTGKGAKLRNVATAMDGDILRVSFAVEWTGGLFGGSYLTTVEWRCSETASLGVRLESDSAVIPTAPGAVQLLGVQFEKHVFPHLKKTAEE